MREKFTRANLALFSLFVIAIYIGIVVLDFRLPIVNPSDELNEVPIMSDIYLTSPDKTGPVDCVLVTYLRYHGTLVTGKQVIMTSSVLLITPLAKNISRGRVFFPEARTFPLRNESGIPINNAIDLANDGTDRLVGGSQSIFFPTPGDFSSLATFAISYTNGTRLFTKFNPIGQYEIHIEPASVLIAERFNRATMGISLALMYFAFLEAYYLWLDHKKSAENKEGKLIQEIEKLIQRLDRFIQKNSQDKDAQTDQTKKKRYH